MNTPKRLTGAGGGGGGKGGGGRGSARVAVEDPDTLQSIQYAKVIDLISEGPIWGPATASAPSGKSSMVNDPAILRSIYLNDVPIANADGSTNFTGIEVVARYGTLDQAPIPEFNEVSNEVSVGVRVRADLPAVRLLSSQNLDAVRVTINVPALTYQDMSTGDMHGSSVQIAIDLNINNGGWQQQVLDTISGKCTSPYKRAYRIALSGAGPWQVRVRRITADATASNVQNQTWWDSYAEVIEQKFRYPLSAVVGLKVDARQFSNIPTRAFDIKGLLIRVPSNYTPETRAYAGLWDGTFKTVWSDNPAWVFYDMLTESRYGVGDSIDASLIDKWSLYDIARYCDERVPDGFGGTEPRFTCNLYLQTQEDAWKVLANLASIFRGMMFWAGGQVTPRADRPGDIVAVFTDANVIEGLFQYEGSSRQTRYNVALVTWNDPADGYRPKVEYVEDADSIAECGVLDTQVVAFGCASRGQAHRVGKWLIYTSLLETEMVGFSTGLEGNAVAPGDLIQIADAARAGARIGGRVVAATTTAITLDAEVTLTAGQIYTLIVQLPDGSIAQANVSSAAGAVLTLASPLAAAPQAQAIWLLSSSALTPQTFRVMSVTEKDGLQIDIKAIAHNPSKFNFIEQGWALAPQLTSNLSIIPGLASNLSVVETIYLINPTTAGSRVTLSWTPPANCARFIATARRGTEPPLRVETLLNSADFNPAPVGNWTFTVTCVNALGTAGPAATLNAHLAGLSAPPDNVASLSIAIINTGIRLTWSACAAVDYAGTQLRLGTDWASATPVAQIAGTSWVLPWQPAGLLTVLARHVDLQGDLSAMVFSADLSIQAPAAVNLTRQLVQANSLALQWTDSKTGQPVSSYEFFVGPENAAFADCVLKEQKGWDSRSTVMTFEASGTYRIYALARDVAGNISTPTVFNVAVTLPNNFVLVTSYDFALLSDSIVNGVLRAGALWLPLSPTRRWRDHFEPYAPPTTGGKISAGDARFFQSAPTSGSCTDLRDLGKVFSSARVSVSVVSQALAGNLTPSVQISWSAVSASGPWVDGAAGASDVQATNARWLKITYSVSGSGGDDLLKLTRASVQVSIEPQEETATVELSASDTNGTLYVCTKPFFDVQRVFISQRGAGIAYTDYVIDDSGAPDTPARVYLLAWDKNANRVGGTVDINIKGA
jgi:predicted phage tail protein